MNFGFWDDRLYYQKSQEWEQQLEPEQFKMLEKMLCDNRNYESLEPYPNAVKTINFIQDNGHRVDFISSRASEVTDGTRTSLLRAFAPRNPPNFHLVGYENRGLAKLKIVKMIKAQWILEDDVKTMEIMAHNGISCIMLKNNITADYVFDKDIRHMIYRAENWYEVELFVKKLLTTQ